MHLSENAYSCIDVMKCFCDGVWIQYVGVLHFESKYFDLLKWGMTKFHRGGPSFASQWQKLRKRLSIFCVVFSHNLFVYEMELQWLLKS